MKVIPKVLLSLLVLIFFYMPLYADTIYQGIEISEQEKNIDFKAIKSSGISVVYIRACEGASNEDNFFKVHYDNAISEGLKVGFYQDITARSEYEAVQQAEYFYGLIKYKQMDCYPAMKFKNFGDLSIAEINQIAKAYLTTLEKLTGITPIIFSTSSDAFNVWYCTLIKYPLWVADYNGEVPENTGAWSSWTGFQYTASGNLVGIDAPLKLNDFKQSIFIETPVQILQETSVTLEAPVEDKTTLQAASYYVSIGLPVAILTVIFFLARQEKRK
jgi:lysozyme